MPHYFLSGYAVENFFALHRGYLDRLDRQFSTEIAFTEEQEEKYLSKIANRLSEAKSISDEVNPFEIIDFTNGVTFLENKKIDISVLGKIAHWLGQFPNSKYCQIKVYPSVALTVKATDSPWENIFRCLQPDHQPRNPLLSIHFYTHPRYANRVQVNIYTTSHVWLHEGLDPINSRIDTKAADANLANLVALVQAIIAGKQENFKDFEVTLSGSVFFKDTPRIQQAFSIFDASVHIA